MDVNISILELAEVLEDLRDMELLCPKADDIAYIFDEDCDTVFLSWLDTALFVADRMCGISTSYLFDVDAKFMINA